ncbi:MAG: peptide chain release factor N(5)-glutamine methyltransferase [Acidobacteriota bacterium]
MVKKSISTPIRIWLRDAAEEFASAGIASALLDAEIILAHTLRKSRTWLHAHSEDLLDPRVKDIANARAQLRLDRTPIAYIIGHKEFYGRLFKVTPSVLIPRPESEEIITLLKKHLPQDAALLLDIGTGSGCLGITAKLELPELTVTLADISRHALKVAETNAEALGAVVTIIKSDLLAGIPAPYDVVLANLPYVDEAWERSPETRHEPELALFADDGGLKLIYRLLEQLPAALTPSGIALVEADPEQHAAIIATAKKYSLSPIATSGYIVVLGR